MITKKLIIQLFCIYLVVANSYRVLGAIPSFSADQVWEKLQSSENILIIDTRPEEGYQEGHIPTAINLPLSNLGAQQISEINSYHREENIFYCSCINGANAEYTATELTNLGLKNAYFMHDDFRDWIYDIVTGSEPGVVSNHTNSTKNASWHFGISDLLPLNLGLLVVVIAIIIYKKRK